jgi:hypothetical protein
VGLRNFVNGLDFWDKEENAKQAAAVRQQPSAPPATLPQQGQLGFHVLKPGNAMIPQTAPPRVIGMPVNRPKVQQPALPANHPTIGGNSFGSKVGNALINNPLTDALDRTGEKVFGSKPAQFVEQTVGNTAQSAVRGGIALNQNIGNAEVAAAHAMGKAKNIQTQTGQQFVNDSIGNNANKLVGYTGTARQQALDAINNASWLIPGAGKGVATLGARAGEAVAGRVAPVVGETIANGLGKGVGTLTTIGGHAQVGGVTAGLQGGVSQAIADPNANAASIAQATADNYKMGLAFGGAGSAAAAAAPHIVPTTRLVANKINTAQNTMNGWNSLQSDIARSDSQLASYQAAQAQSPIGSQQSENWQRKIDMETANGAALRQQAATSKPSITTRLVGSTPGLTVGGPNALQYMYAKKHGKVFDGVDGKPRFEIDDSKSWFKGMDEEAAQYKEQLASAQYKLSVNPNDVGAQQQLQIAQQNLKTMNSPSLTPQLRARLQSGARLGDILDHPTLYENYPDLKDVSVKFDDFSHTPTTRGQVRGGNIALNEANLTNPNQLHSTLLHEIQHTIQARENTAKGGMPNTDELAFKNKILKEQLAKTNKELATMVPGSNGHAPLLQKRNDLIKALDETQDQYGSVEGKAHQNYERLAGEAEARAVAARKNLKPSERYLKQEPSYRDLDKQSIHKQPNMSNKQLDSLTPEAIDGLKQQGFKGVSNGKRTVRFDESKPTFTHETNANWDKFDPNKIGTGQGDHWLGRGMYLQKDGTPKFESYGKNKKQFTLADDAKVFQGDIAKYAKDKGVAGWNVADRESKGLTRHLPRDVFKGNPELIKQLQKDGYHGYHDQGGELVMYDPSKLVDAAKSQPATSLRSTFYDSLDVPKDELIIRGGDGPAMSIDKRAHMDDLSPEQNKTVADYAEYLKEVGQGNGVDIHPDGRRITNNFRSDDLKGKQMTNSDWFDEARKQLESGKADAMAQDEWNAAKPTAPSTKLAPQSQPKAVPPQQLPVSEPPVGNPLGNDTPKAVKNTLTTGGKEGRQNLSPEVQAGIKGEHEQRSTNKLDETAHLDISKMDDQQAIQSAHDRLNVDLGKIDDTDVAFANQAIERAQRAGRTEDAINLHDKLSEHLVKNGQTIQAASLLYRLSPEGMFYKARRDIQKGGGTISSELEATLRSQSDAINAAKGEAAKTTARAKFGKTVADNIPKGVSSDIISVWKAGLLSGSKTFSGGVVSNVTFAGMKKVSDFPAALADAGFSMLPGKERTKALTFKGIGEGTKTGAVKGTGTLKTGIDERNISGGGKYEQYGELNFKNKVVQNVFGKPSNMVFRGLSALDQPVYYAAAKNNLYDLAKVEALNNNVPFSQRKAYVDNLVQNPSKQMAQKARDAAEKAVLQQDTVASKVINGAKGSIDRMDIPPVARATAKGVIDVLAPFVRVPSAFISRTVDFTPLGVGREVFEQVSNGKFDQRKMSEAIGEGITGTGIIALGIALSQANLLSGDYPKNDPKEAQRWKTDHIEPNSVKFGNKWLSLNYLGPVGLLFNAGKQFHEAKDEGAVAKVAASVGGIGQGLLGQSFLQGFSGFSDAITDPERNAKSFINSQASSLIPAWSNDLANLSDDMQRQADTTLQTVKNRVPGLRQTNKVKQDVYGNPLSEKTTGVNHLNPLKPSDIKGNDVTKEVTRLHSVDPKNPDLQVTPTPVNRTLSIESQTVKLSDDQRYDLQKKVGQATQKAWGDLIQTDEYKALDDAGKAKALSDLRSDAAGATQRQYVVDNNLATYSKQMSKSQQKFLDGNVNLTKYTKAADGNSTNDDETYADKFKTAKQEFDKNKDWSTVQRAKKQKELKKLAVQKDYDNDTVSLYGMAKEDVYDLVSKDKNGKGLVDKLIKYGDALVNAGLEDTNKFKDKYGNIVIRPKEKGSSTASGRKATAGAWQLYSGSNNPISMNKSLRSLVEKASKLS